MPGRLACLALVPLALAAPPAAAQPLASDAEAAAAAVDDPLAPRPGGDPRPYAALHAFERDFAVAVYATGHAGSYLAGGLGGRLRWELLEWLGVEAYLEATMVDWPGGGFRHDYPNGFNVYVPVRLDDFRVRAFLGFCDILSFVEPEEQGAPRADDVLIGAHGGVGVELAVHAMASLFADLQVNVYGGHDRTVGGWTGGVHEELVPFWNVQLNLGAQLHVGR
jgi:hypothetical protein